MTLGSQVGLVTTITLLLAILLSDHRQRRRYARSLRRSYSPQGLAAGGPPPFRLWKCVLAAVAMAAPWILNDGAVTADLRGIVAGVILPAWGVWTFYGNLEGPLVLNASPGRGRFIQGLLLVMALGLCVVFVPGDFSRFMTRLEAAEARAALADVVRRARRDWQPGSGVVEGRSGTLVAWLAVSEDVWIDGDFERAREREEGAWRVIPIDVVVLNDSFEDLDLEPTADRLWVVHITDGGGTPIRTFAHPLAAGSHRLYPAERINFSLDWDGRNEAGALAPPGRYEVKLRTAPVQAAREVEVSLVVRISDLGPEVTVIRSAVAEQTERIQRQAEISRMMQESMRRMQEMNEQLRRLQQMGR